MSASDSPTAHRTGRVAADMLCPQAGRDQLSPAGLGQIYVRLRLPGVPFREPSRELLCHLGSHFETAQPDRRSKRSKQDLRAAAEQNLHLLDGAYNHPSHASLPTGMNCGYCLFFRVCQQDGQAVSRFDSDAGSGLRGNQSIRLLALSPIVAAYYLGRVDLL